MALKKPKRIDIIPGAILTVAPGRVLNLNAHLLLSGNSWDALEGNVVTVVRGPKKTVDGINLVKVQCHDGQEYECFYCDVLKNCVME